MTDHRISLEQALGSRRGSAGPVIDVDEAMVKFVFTTIGDEWFAFHGDTIAEILADCPVFFLPGCPPSLEGIINVRGDIESVINLPVVLDYPERPPDGASRILLGKAGGLRSGIRVDSVQDVRDLPESSILPPPHTISGPLAALVSGIVTMGAHHVGIIDLARLFEDYIAGKRG